VQFALAKFLSGFGNASAAEVCSVNV